MWQDNGLNGKAGLPQIRLYDLRHSHATLLLIAEEYPKVVAERLGHSTIGFNNGHLLKCHSEYAAKSSDKLTKML